MPPEADRKIVLGSEALFDTWTCIERLFSLEVPAGIVTDISDREFRSVVCEILCPKFNIFPPPGFDVDLKHAVFYRMLFLVLLKLTRIHGTISFVLDGRAVRNTLLLAGLIFFVNFLLNLRQIHVSQPVALLHGEEQGEREPKTKWITALLGIVFLGIGYEMAVTCQSSLDALSKFFEAIVFVIVGTYCLFSAGSIALLKMLKKNKKVLLSSEAFYQCFRHAIPDEAECGRSFEYLYSVYGRSSCDFHQHLPLGGHGRSGTYQISTSDPDPG